ncbi:olfactory receptor 6N1-like [Bufo gargarizans]|uniref:olfactory receptor 6N1-like n=1 Tax=Bufo gargarizans TaxID=30331 RepID=UPI001CF1F7E7|nr:olfactory receptor 6N1-like [Bufo gargarizans]
MADINHTMVTEFVLIAFEDLHQFQILLFMVVLLIYITCIGGNIIIYLLIKLDVSLHTPMYYFISVFAILEIIFVSIIIPKLLDILIAGRNRISFVACFLQLYCADTAGGTQCYLLTVMAFDRHFAITNPLRYVGIMSQACTKLAVFSWIAGLITAFVLIIFTASLDYCGPNKIQHFFCDLTPLQNLACSDPHVSNLVTSVACIFGILFPFVIIIGLYIHIIIKVLEVKSVDGKHKAFSTCSSHLVVSSLFFCTSITVYVKPSDSQNDKFLAFIYTVVTPLLNPFIYTFRNRAVKCAFLKNFDMDSGAGEQPSQNLLKQSIEPPEKRDTEM